MFSHRFRKPGAIELTPLLLALLFAVACGSASPPTPAAAPETAVSPSEAPPTSTPLRVGGVRTPTPALQLAGSTPTPEPEPTPAPALPSENFGGHIPMADYSAPPKRYLWWQGANNQNPIFNTLVEWDPEDPDPNVIKGDLAESWEVRDGGLTYVFHLNEQARWHDGMPVTADDVGFSLDAMVCPDCFEILKGQIRSGLITFGIAYEPGQTRAIDQHTAEVNLRSPFPAFLDTLCLATLAIGPRHTILDEGKVQTLYESENLNGSGPFKHLGYTKDVKNDYEKNEDYWKEGYPRIDSMTHFIITDPGTMVAAFKSGQVLMQNSSQTPLNPPQAIQLGEDMAGELTVHWMGPAGYRGMQFNTTKKPFDDVRARRAVHLALHRQPIIEIISGGLDLLGTPLPPDSWYSYTSEEAAQMPGFRELDGEKHPDDLAEAHRLLAEAGLPAEGLQVQLSTRDAIGYPDTAAVIADQLRQFLNWDVTLRVMESAAGFAAYDAGDFQFNYQGATYNFEDPNESMRLYGTGGAAARRAAGGIREGFVPAGLQELINMQAVEPDKAKRKELTMRAHDILLNEDNVYVGVFWNMRHHPVSNRIQNFYPHPSTYANRKWEHIWCDPRC